MELESIVERQYSTPQPMRRSRYVATAHVPSKSLYVSHLISAWVSRGFEFGSTLFLATVYPGTLLPLSVYALVRAASAIVLASALGQFIDRTERLKVIRCSVVGQRVAVTLSCLAFLVQLFRVVNPGSIQDIAVFLVLVLLACLEKLCATMNTISVERDWVVVIAGTNESILQEMNSQMRRIDLFCKLGSPLFVALLDGYSSKLAVVTVCSMSALLVAPEYFLIAWVYNKTPQLGEQCPNRQQSDSTDSEYGGREHCMRSWMRSMKLYAKSPAFSPSLSLSLLYFTVLSFSSQMITYLLSLQAPKLTSWHIGVLRTASTVFEISSTFIAPFLMNKIGAVRTGIWSMSWQWAFLTIAVSTFWASKISGTLQVWIFVGGVMLSRMGLWSFDLSAQLLVQNSVDSGQRGSFSATESSLQNWFELCTFAMTIVWSRPDQFKFPATISLLAVYTAAGCYARFVRIERGHLIHVPECCKVVSRYESIRSTDDEEERGY